MMLAYLHQAAIALRDHPLSLQERRAAIRQTIVALTPFWDQQAQCMQAQLPDGWTLEKRRPMYGSHYDAPPGWKVPEEERTPQGESPGWVWRNGNDWVEIRFSQKDDLLFAVHRSTGPHHGSEELGYTGFSWPQALQLAQVAAENLTTIRQVGGSLDRFYRYNSQSSHEPPQGDGTTYPQFWITISGVWEDQQDEPRVPAGRSGQPHVIQWGVKDSPGQRADIMGPDALRRLRGLTRRSYLEEWDIWVDYYASPTSVREPVWSSHNPEWKTPPTTPFVTASDRETTVYPKGSLDVVLQEIRLNPPKARHPDLVDAHTRSVFALKSETKSTTVAVGGFKWVIQYWPTRGTKGTLISIVPNAASAKKAGAYLTILPRIPTLRDGKPTSGTIEHQGRYYSYPHSYSRKVVEALKLAFEAFKRSKGDLLDFYQALGEQGFCALCGAGLTDPLSRARGVGPECIKSLGGQMMAAMLAEERDRELE